MNNPLKAPLDNTKLFMGIATPVIGVLFFFFSLQSDIAANSEKIQANTASIESLENKVDNISANVNELKTDVKVMVVELSHLTDTIHRIEKHYTE
jgi:peptidoglycan hydrolase CwlO-like protein